MIKMVERDRNDPWLGSRGEMKKRRETVKGQKRGGRVYNVFLEK